MRVRHLIVFGLLLTTGTTTFGQQWTPSRFELLGGVSVCQMFGDVGGSASDPGSTLLGLKDISFSAMRPGVNLGTRYNALPLVSFKGLVSSYVMTASDKGSRNENRGFKATVFVTDFAVTGEYYIKRASDSKAFSIMSVRGGVRPYGNPLSLYVYAGLGGAYFNSSGNATLKESPRYVGGTGFTAIIPIGLGVKVNLMPRVAFNGELGTRMAFTDNLDAYTSPFSKANDIYYTLTLGVSYKIYVKRTGNSRWRF